MQDLLSQDEIDALLHGVGGGDIETAPEAPPPEALRLLREEIDPHGLCRLESKDGRAEALRLLGEMA